MHSEGYAALLTREAGNAKLRKGRRANLRAVIMHLSPIDLAYPGRSVCAWASEGCAAVCLNVAGRGQIRGELAAANLLRSPIHRARIARTRHFWQDRAGFLARLECELGGAASGAGREGETLAARLNGTSDLAWEGFKLADGRNLFERFPTVQFYDYTKSVRRALAWARGKMAENYHLTFSRSEETSVTTVRELLAAGVNVAVVFRGKRLPKTWQGARVVDGLATDYRFLDPRGVIVGLLAKGRARRDRSGFVVDLA